MMSSELSLSAWRKSTRSGNGGGNCVEVAARAQLIAVRDSKRPVDGVLAFPSAAWRSFTGRIKSGALDL